jgi:hypothetical protein
MALIYLRHPVHGEKVATLELEAEHDEKHGWTRYTLDVEAPSDQPVNELRPRRRRESADAKLL